MATALTMLSTYAVGDDGNSKPVKPSVNIRGIAHRRLVRHDDCLQPGLQLGSVQRQSEIARDAERVRDPRLPDAFEKVLGKLHDGETLWDSAAIAADTVTCAPHQPFSVRHRGSPFHNSALCDHGSPLLCRPVQ